MKRYVVKDRRFWPVTRLAYFEYRLEEEQRWLEFMIDSNRRDDETAAMCVQEARDAVWLYQQDSDESHLVTAEAFEELARNLKENKYTIGDIRKQREKIQCQKKELTSEQERKQPIEPSKSSTHSSS